MAHISFKNQLGKKPHPHFCHTFNIKSIFILELTETTSKLDTNVLYMLINKPLTISQAGDR